MTFEAIEKRRDRLCKLSLGLALELAVVRKGDDPMLYLERREYLLAIGDALAGVETARIALAKALIRLRRAEAA